MSWIRSILTVVALAALAGCATDGGPVGSGVSSVIRGNVADVQEGAARFIPAGAGEPILPFPVLVSLEGYPDLSATTNDLGEFALEGDFAGAVTLHFSRAGRLLASLPLDIPDGSTIVLDDIELRPALPGGIRTRRIRQSDFYGRLFMIDCDAGIALIDDNGPRRRQFLVRLSPETVIRLGPVGRMLECDELRQTEPVLLEGLVRADRTIDASSIVVRPPQRPR